MSISALMQALADAGAPMEAILIAVRAVEAKDAEIAARDAAVAEKRAKDAERKRNVRGMSVDNPETVQATPTLSRPPNENNSNPPTHTHPDMTIPRAREAFPILDCSDQQTWVDFLKNRKLKKLPCTVSAHAKLLADLDKWSQRTGWPPGQVFSTCVAKGWGAIYDPRDDDNGRQRQRNGKPTTREIGQGLVESILGRTGDSRTDGLPRLGAPGGYVSGGS